MKWTAAGEVLISCAALTMKDEDLIGKITRWDVIKFDGKNPEIVCYLITGMDENGGG